MPENDESDGGNADPLIRDVRLKVESAVEAYNDERTATGSISRDTKHRLASAALDYYQRLYPYRDEDALSEPWDDRGVAWLEEAADDLVTVEVETNRANGSKRTETRPRLITPHVSAGEIRDAIRELHDIANELGFAQQPKKSVPRTEIDNELIEEVEKWRKQQT